MECWRRLPCRRPRSRSIFQTANTFAFTATIQISAFSSASPCWGACRNQMTIQVTKRLQARDGSFGGVLVFSLNPDYLTSLHRQVDLGQTGNVTVIGLDSVIRARFTSSDSSEAPGVGSSMAAGRSFKDAAFADAGTHTSASVIDGVVRIFNWRKVSGYPLIVTVGLGKAEALSAARSPRAAHSGDRRVRGPSCRHHGLEACPRDFQQGCA